MPHDEAPSSPPAPVPFATLQAQAASGDPEAIYQLGRAFYAGEGTKKSLQNAMGCFLAAAAQQHPAALFFLALHFGTRANKDADAARSRAYLQQASALGHGGATRTLAEQHAAAGEHDAAERLFTLAAQQQDPAALFRQATRHTAPAGEAEHASYSPEALAQLTHAATLGHEGAQDLLARVLREGAGAPADPARAYFWSLVVASSGLLHRDEAKKRAERIAKRLEPAVEARVRREAADWVAGHPAHA